MKEKGIDIMDRGALLSAIRELAIEFNRYAEGGNSEILSIKAGEDFVLIHFYDEIRKFTFVNAINYLSEEVSTLHAENGE